MTAKGNDFERMFGTCVTAHSWNADRTMVALCPNTPQVQVWDAKTWKLLATLAQHDQIVTAIDWAPKTNRIVTSSQDRNSYVWNPKDDGSWEPVLVLLRLSRSATCVKWSPNEDKFAVGSGEKSVCICQFMEDFGATGGWTSKMLKKPLKSTVLSVDWHPNNMFVLVGSADFKARVFNAFLKDVDGRKPAVGPYGVNPADKKAKFGTCIAEYGNAKGWVHDAKFNTSGTGLAFVGHDSSCHFAAVPTEPVEAESLPIKMDSVTQTIKTKGLPYKSIAFLGDERLIAAGHDANVDVFDFAGEWSHVGSVSAPSALKAGGAKKKSAASAARSMWEDKADFGGAGARGGSSLESVHQNSIAGIELLDAKSFSTCGYDGRIVTWDVACLDSAVKAV